ncbi:MAG TPA: hemerythrin domain-containing protein [Iamia sp.]|nr:hemerythrin domain-containing protein [Iamia sp.]
MSTADLRGYRAIHTALRDAAHAMAAAAPTLSTADPARLAAFRSYWRGYAGEVLAHHTTEDDVVFPELVRRVPALADLMDRADADHHHLDELMDDVTAALAAVADGARPDRLGGLLREVADHMDEHLGMEDERFLPMIEVSFSEEEYAALEARALEIIGVGRQAAFTIPFIAASVDDETRRHLLGDAPLPVRVILRVFRGRHARMRARALGAPRPTAVAA